MAWLYEKSAVWRGIVAVTAASPWAMAGFTGVSLGAAYYMGKGFMWLTEKDPEQAKQQLAKHDDRMSSQVGPVRSISRTLFLLCFSSSGFEYSMHVYRKSVCS